MNSEQRYVTRFREEWAMSTALARCERAADSSAKRAVRDGDQNRIRGIDKRICESQNSPSDVEKMRATLSVLPVMRYSPEGLHAISYTCMDVHLESSCKDCRQRRDKTY